MRRKIKFVGDHSDVHCGCQAVFDFMQKELASFGEIVDGEDFDLLVINGEGSMHHSTGPMHRKIKVLIEAEKRNVEVWLLNSVWQQNLSKFDEYLKRVTYFVVRDIDSYDDLVRRHNISPLVFPDVSLKAKIDKSCKYRDLNGRICTTDFYSKEFNGFVKLTDGLYSNFTYLDMKRLSWSEFVRTLSTSSLLITGRHHAVMAACVAKTPFVALEGNTHKVKGFLRLANSCIPVCESPNEIPYVEKWAYDNPKAYSDLFAWVDALPDWSPDCSII